MALGPNEATPRTKILSAGSCNLRGMQFAGDSYTKTTMMRRKSTVESWNIIPRWEQFVPTSVSNGMEIHESMRVPQMHTYTHVLIQANLQIRELLTQNQSLTFESKSIPHI